MVPFGFRIARRRASCPTSRSFCSVKATPDPVLRSPSAFGITVGEPPSTAAITEFVVPRSMPTSLAMIASSDPRDLGEALPGQHQAVLHQHGRTGSALDL